MEKVDQVKEISLKIEDEMKVIQKLKETSSSLQTV